jgi:hypothetical protein
MEIVWTACLFPTFKSAIVFGPKSISRFEAFAFGLRIQLMNNLLTNELLRAILSRCHALNWLIIIYFLHFVYAQFKVKRKEDDL